MCRWFQHRAPFNLGPYNFACSFPHTILPLCVGEVSFIGERATGRLRTARPFCVVCTDAESL